MQYPIPQFIEEEGKIISFLTFRQFWWLVGGGGACIVFFYILPFAFFIVAALITAGLVGVIAFVKIDNVSVIKIFLNFIGFSFAAKTYTWERKESAHPLKVQKITELPTTEGPAQLPKMRESKLQSIRKLVETKR